MLRSAFVSLFWAVFSYRKKKDGLTLQALAKAIPANKAEVSRWFKGDPNWTVNTIASVANALNVDLEMRAVDRTSGAVFTAAGVQTPAQNLTPTVARVEDMSVTKTGPAAKSPVIRGAATPVRTSAAA
jgi:transcriptional regulator with XRE-family HTH domain